ncbi:hypothetical protein ACFQ6B_06520 [Streptomyces wedmorensis]|uniref:Uncharacterized protein n=1 Tax=Streptomyces wedmorensis TaxID=43759 RepID=A0ABW6IZB9_STRWE
MVLPLVPLVVIIGSGVMGGGGVVAGAVGTLQVKRAEARMQHDRARFETRHTAHRAQVDRTNVALQTFGRSQERAQHEVVCRMRDFLERHSKQVRAHEHRILDGVDASNINQVAGMAKLDPDVAGWARGAVYTALVAGATPVVLRKSASQLAKASTGTPIVNLRGAAAERALRAFFGGGSRASGGGGEALGTTVLKVSAVGPSALVAGLTMKNRGSKARAEADSQRTRADDAIARLDLLDERFRGVRKRAHELDDILGRLISQATSALDLLESEPFDFDAHGKRLQTALVLVTSVVKVASAPVADEDGNLDMSTERLIFNYRDARKETPDA